MADKYHTDTQGKISGIIYTPWFQDSGNLETGTRTITATTKPGSADYSASLTMQNADDGRLMVRRLCQRLNLHIDSFGGAPAATRLYYSVAVNGVERASGEFTAAGADNPIAWDLTEGQFNLGSANVITVYLWVDRGNAVISVAQIWQGVGTCTIWWSSFPLEISHTGLVQVSANFTRIGNGTTSSHLMALGSLASMSESLQADASSKLSIVSGSFAIRLKGTVTTDLNYISNINIELQSL
jgi:hypothetical protein